MLQPDEAWRVLREAEMVCSADQVRAAVAHIAGELERRVGERLPLVLSVMGGGVVFTGQLLPMLGFPLEFDYIHVTRYRGTTRGGEIRWRVEPHSSVASRTVVVLDDILDEGHTAAAIKSWLERQGAAEVLLAVLADKDIGRPELAQDDLALDFGEAELGLEFGEL